MSRLISALAVSGLLIGALSIPAQAKTQSKTKNVSVIIRGTASAPTAGPCSTGYADQCLGTTPSTSCKCVQVLNATVSGTGFGKGSTADLFVTIDEDAATSSSDSRCEPVFASANLSNPKTGLTVTLNISATSCDPLTSNNMGPVLGGWGIESASNEATGYGTVTGTHGKSTGAVTMKFSGPVTTP